MARMMSRMVAVGATVLMLGASGVGAGEAAPATATRPQRPAKVVYLTFDDGPSRYTPQVLRVLSKHRARATFFMIGTQAAADPAMVRRVRAHGHTLGNHTYSHPWLTRISSAAVASQLRRTDAVLGHTTCLRPPGGFVNASVRRVARAQGKATVLWDVDPQDWRRPGVAAITRTITRQARPGAVILLHDGGGERSQSVAALDRALTTLRARGYRFAPLPACR